MQTQSLPFKPFTPKAKGLTEANYTLPEPLFIGQWVVPAGTALRLITAYSFGAVVLPEGTKDVRGFIIPVLWFKV